VRDAITVDAEAPPRPTAARPVVTVDRSAPAANVGPLLALLERLARRERRPAAAARGPRRRASKK
jgi:hypothetical protein